VANYFTISVANYFTISVANYFTISYNSDSKGIKNIPGFSHTVKCLSTTDHPNYLVNIVSMNPQITFERYHASCATTKTKSLEITMPSGTTKNLNLKIKYTYGSVR